MGLSTGTNVAGRVGLMDIVFDHIINEVGSPPAGAGAVISRDRGVPGFLEQWITIPADRWSGGGEFPVGMRTSTGSPYFIINMNLSHLPFATASAGDTRAFDRMDGQPMNRVDDDASSTADRSPNIRDIPDSPNLLRYWIFTNPNFGALTTEYAVGEETYIYVFVEIDAGRYRHFGWCSPERQGTWPTTESIYIFGSHYSGDTWYSNLNQGIMGGPSERDFNSGFSTVEGIARSGLQIGYNQLYQGDRDAAPRPWIDADGFSSARNYDLMKTNAPVASLGRSGDNDPASFSGVAYREQMAIYSSRMDAAQQAVSDREGTSVRWQYLARLPDAFFCNIRDLDPGTTFVDGTERFIVFPIFSKPVESGNSGILIRNPNA